MPDPSPPPPDWDLFSGSATEFNAAQAAAQVYGYDSTNMAFKDSAGTPCYLYVGVSQNTAGHIAWYFRNSGNVGTAAPFCRIPQLTFDAIKSGSLSNGQISYNGHVYLLKIELDSNGKQIAFAYQVQ